MTADFNLPYRSGIWAGTFCEVEEHVAQCCTGYPEIWTCRLWRDQSLPHMEVQLRDVSGSKSFGVVDAARCTLHIHGFACMLCMYTADLSRRDVTFSFRPYVHSPRRAGYRGSRLETTMARKFCSAFDGLTASSILTRWRTYRIEWLSELSTNQSVARVSSHECRFNEMRCRNRLPVVLFPGRC